MTGIRAKVVQGWQGCAITIHENSPRFANALLQPIHSTIARATRVNECRCVRDDGGEMTCQLTPDGAGHDIFAPGWSRMPLVLAPRRIPRPQIRSQASPAVPRRSPGSRAEDCHELDTRRRPKPTVPAVLHDGRGRGQEGRAAHSASPIDRSVQVSRTLGHGPRPCLILHHTGCLVTL
jgi:hypothetical protein